MTLILTGVTAAPPLSVIEPIASTRRELSANVSDPDVNGRSYRRAALTSIVRPTAGGNIEFQVECWWTNENKAMIAVHSRPEGGTDFGFWRYYIYDGENGLADIELSNPSEDHAGITIGFDPDGYLHVAYDTRNSALKYRKSTVPIEYFNGALTATLTMVTAHNESTMNYPQFFNDGVGNLVFMARRGSSSSGLILFYVYDHTVPEWTAAPGTATKAGVDGGTVTGLLIDGPQGGYGTAYVYGIGCHSEFDLTTPTAGKSMHFAFHWRTLAGGDPYTNRDVTYFKWNGTDFYHADGEGQSMPVTPSSANDVADAAPVGLGAGAGLIGASNVDCDDNDLPFITYARNDSSSDIQVYVVRHNGTAWQTPVALTSQTAITSAGDPENANYRSPMVNVRKSDGLLTVAANRFGLTGVHVFHSGDYTTFTDVQVDARDAGQWSPTCDVPYWKRNEKLLLPVQSDPGYQEIIEWDSSAVSPVTPPSPTFPSVPSDATRAAAVATFIAALASSGLDAAMATFQVYTRLNGEEGFYDLIRLTDEASLTGAVNFQPWKGFLTNGTNSYIDTGFNPSTDGASLYTQNDAHFGLYSWTAAQSDGVSGVRDQTSGTKQMVMRTRSTGNLFLAAINSSGTDTIASTDGSGHFIVERTSSSNCQAYRNGSSIGTFTETSSAPPNGNFVLGARNQIAGGGAPGAFGALQFGLFHAGASLGTTDAATLGGLVDDLITALWP